MHLYKTLWGAVGDRGRYPDLLTAIPAIASEGWDGVSAALIAFDLDPSIGTLDDLRRLCADHGLGVAVMVHTSGDDVDAHLAHLGREIERATAVSPHHIICHGGVDAWSFDQARAFYWDALVFESEFGIPIAHETHRSRLLHSPWQAQRILAEFPQVKTALDVSHWVVLAERMLEDQQAAIDMAAARAIHVDARIGHEEAPQVPDPRDPAWASHRETFERWWDSAIGPDTVVVPEYGPPPYLPTVPHSGEPVADLWDVCDWAKQQLRDRYG